MTLEQKVDICLRFIAALDPGDVNSFANDYNEVWNCISDARNALETETEPAVISNLQRKHEEIEALLTELGVASHILGWDYIVNAVMRCMEDKQYARNITGRLYPTVAEAFGTTPNRIERAIRHAIERAWMTGNPSAQNRFFGYTCSPDKGKPTNAQFIVALAREVERRLGAASV